jgi:hypothetical protein
VSVEVDGRPIDAPHVTQKRYPGGFKERQLGQTATGSPVSETENWSAGASGRERGADGLGADAGSADVGLADVGLADVGLVDVGLADVGLADTGDADAGLADGGAADEVFVTASGIGSDGGVSAISTRSTRSRPFGGVGGTPRP